jgi:5-methylcytosine-specific restriction endonuclease McrA
LVEQSNHTDRKGKVSLTRKKKIDDNRQFIKDIKLNGKCYLCGEKRHYVLDFHHLVSEDKDSEIGLLVKRSSSRKRLISEIEKCIILCSNCHRELHFLGKEIELFEKVKNER